MWKCKYCNKEFYFTTASEKANHSRWCDSNPKRKEYSDKLVRARAAKTSFGNQYTVGKIMSNKTREKLRKISTGRKHTEKTKAKLSKIGLENNYQRLCKTTIIYKHIDGYDVKLDSSWEKCLAEILDGDNIKWIRPEPLKWVDKDGKKHNYFPDFYLTEYDIYLDPKNEYCMRVQKEKIEYVEKNYQNVYFLRETQIDLAYLDKLLNTHP